MKTDSIELRLDPWFDVEEWKFVKDLVIKKNLLALKYFEVWRCRVSRLPAGIETTYALLEASSQMENILTISMAVNRFLNHISHIGMNVWGVRKLHDAARMLKLPSWVVDIRHETTHGHMPSLTILQASFAVCWSWLCTNYWSNEYKEVTPRQSSQTDQENLATSLLECFLYLRIYQVWGTTQVNDIAESREVYLHMKNLWSQGCSDKNVALFGKMSVKQAQGTLKKEISELDIEPESLAKILVNRDLLVPEITFLQSLLGEDEQQVEHVELPKILLTVWKEYIQKIDSKIGAKVLIDLLVARLSSRKDGVDETSREYCAAWVVELSEALLGRSSHIVLSKEHGCTISDLEDWISRPNRLVQMLLPCFVSLVNLDSGRTLMLENLIAAAISDSDDENGDRPIIGHQIYTVDQLTLPNLSPVGQQTFGPRQGWVKEKSTKWQSELLISFPNQNWQSTWLPSDTEWLSSQESTDSEVDRIPEFEAEQVVWPGQEIAENQASELAPFYRVDHPTQSATVLAKEKRISSSPRRKKIKMN